MISREMSIADVVNENPKTLEIFLNHGMHCFGCMSARFENIEQGALAHGIDVELLLKDLNKTIDTQG